MEAVASEVMLPIGVIEFPGRTSEWTNDRLIEVLAGFGFQFLGPVNLDGLQSAVLPNGWTTEGEVWTRGGDNNSRRWWILDEKGRKRIEVVMKLPWGDYDESRFMMLLSSHPGNIDPCAGW